MFKKKDSTYTYKYIHCNITTNSFNNSSITQPTISACHVYYKNELESKYIHNTKKNHIFIKKHAKNLQSFNHLFAT